MGVLGVALATVSCQAVSAILVTWFLMRAEDIYRLEFHEIRFDLRSLGAVLRIIQQDAICDNIANLLFQIFFNEWDRTVEERARPGNRLLRSFFLP